MNQLKRRLWFTFISASMLLMCMMSTTISANDELEQVYEDKSILTVAPTPIISEIPIIEFQITEEITTESVEILTEHATTEHPSEFPTEQSTESKIKKSTSKTNATSKTNSKKSSKSKKQSVKSSESTEAKVQEISAETTEFDLNSSETLNEISTEIEVSENTEEVTTVAPTEEPTEEPTESVAESATEAPAKKSGSFYVMSEYELIMFAKLIYLEAGNASYKCKLGIASVVMNLMLAEGKSLKSCIYTPGRFSVASRVAGSKYNDSCLSAAREICNNGPIFPRNVKCFRNRHYFSWATPYTCIDNVYFSSY